MTAEVTARPVYHSPRVAASRNQSRHSSSRKSFTSTTTFPPSPRIDSPRTLCTRDGGAFSYKPNHLNQWLIPEDVWTRLPRQLQAAMANLQHAGAAVLTGFERLQQYEQARDVPRLPLVDDELEVQDEEAVLPLPKMPLKLRTFSSDSTRLEDNIYAPVFESSQSTGSPSPSLSLSQTLSPVSPMCLTPSEDAPAIPAAFDKRPRDRSFSTPLEPHNAYYANELAHLRSEAIPRLSHAYRRVETELSECKRVASVVAGDVPTLDDWMATKWVIITRLNQQCKRLTAAHGMGPSGLGWTAP